MLHLPYGLGVDRALVGGAVGRFLDEDHHGGKGLRLGRFFDRVVGDGFFNAGILTTAQLSVVPIVLLARTQWKSSMIRIRGATMRLSCLKEGGCCKVITTLSGMVVS